MDSQPIVCHACAGVLPATDSRTYTPQRGRMIVSNGYCTCPPASEPEAPRQQQQQEQEQEQTPSAPVTMVHA
ncbi:hypothetical protein FHR32_002412 [Streptosporangium album]|uniref:Uncharacterized protein n=1 Tax=Streptosporangium album TaxID=47479 RepID=A0A7W7RUD8_9ACTN|nr:hypothetical protein [Streptosporangium album]